MHSGFNLIQVRLHVTIIVVAIYSKTDGLSVDFVLNILDFLLNNDGFNLIQTVSGCQFHHTRRRFFNRK